MKILKTLYNKCNDSYFWGNELFCPICLKRSKFNLKSKIQICPFCGSSDTIRTLWFFFNMTAIAKDKKTLLINSSGYEKFIQSNQNVTELVFNESEVINTLNAHHEQCYDLIICNYIVERIFDYKTFLKNLCKLLNKDGILVLQSIIDPSFKTTYESMVLSPTDRMRLFGVDNSYRVFGADYDKVISNITGLTSHIIDFSTDEKFFKYGIINNLPIYTFSKASEKMKIDLMHNDTLLHSEIVKHRRHLFLAWLLPFIKLAKRLYNLRYYQGNSDGYTLSWRYWGKIHFTACFMSITSIIIIQLGKFFFHSVTDSFLNSFLFITFNTTAIILFILSMFLIFTYSLNSDSNCEYPSLVKKVLSFFLAFIFVVAINSI